MLTVIADMVHHPPWLCQGLVFYGREDVHACDHWILADDTNLQVETFYRPTSHIMSTKYFFFEKWKGKNPSLVKKDYLIWSLKTFHFRKMVEESLANPNDTNLRVSWYVTTDRDLQVRWNSKWKSVEVLFYIKEFPRSEKILFYEGVFMTMTSRNPLLLLWGRSSDQRIHLFIVLDERV